MSNERGKPVTMTSGPRSSLPQNPNPGGRSPRVKALPGSLEALRAYLTGLEAGAAVPRHPELMQRFGASERTVLRELEEWQRAGRIVRRRGIGTFVTEQAAGPEIGNSVVPTSLVGAETVIAIVQPDHSFFDQCLETLFRHARAVGLTVACRLVEENLPGPSILAAPSPDTAGFIIFSWKFEEMAARLQAAGHRVVLVGVPPADYDPRVPGVHDDHEHGGYLAVRHLLELGHTRIAFADMEDWRDGARGKGHLRALRGWPPVASHGDNVSHTPAVEIGKSIPTATLDAWGANPALARAYFAQPNAPTGIVAWNDHKAMTLIRTLSRAGVSVPDDVSIVSYDALPEGAMVHPALTTVDPHVEQQVQAALNILTRATPPQFAQTVVVVPALIVRESTAAPRSAR